MGSATAHGREPEVLDLSSSLPDTPTELVPTELVVAGTGSTVASIQGEEQGAKGLALRRVLMLVDFLTLLVTTIGVTAVLEGGWPASPKLTSIVLVDVATIGLLASQRLYQSRVSHIRSVEIARLGRVVALAALLAFASERFFDVFSQGREVALRAGVAFVGLVVARGAFRSWLHCRRRKGRNRRPVIIVGTSDERHHLHRLVKKHPESGYEVRGFVGPPDMAPPQEGAPYQERGVPWLGEVPDVIPALRQGKADGALIASNGLDRSELNSIVRSLLKVRAHVHLASGLRGIAHRRVVSTQLAEEPLLYLERVSLAGWQMCLKRALDLVLGTVALVVSLPVLVTAGAAIKLYDGGPVLFRQQRIGRGGKPFTIFKLRTMRTDAEQRLDELKTLNQRSDGPLFKLADDPRVTPVGRVLRVTSIDELPQLVNVILGSMSLVGPRPALPVEVAQFDRELLDRHTARPGITGLWQVEARDDPSFQAYEQWDTYYVDNWSVWFDVAILLSTAQQLIGRAARCLFGRRDKRTGESLLVLD